MPLKNQQQLQKIEKDLQKALYWYQKAADGGDSFVVDFLERFCKKNKLNDEVNVTKEIAVIPGLSLVMILLMVQYFVWRWM